MPFEQLRALVIELVEPDSIVADPDDDPITEFEAQPTTYRPKPRPSTLDDVIASLQANWGSIPEQDA